MTLEIFVICHNRPEQAKEAIRSILNQTSSTYRLIVSDNSTNDAVEKMVREHFPFVEYRRRSSDIPALAHFNTCIGEAAAEYFCMLHDDDTMRENFVSTVTRAIALHPKATAIGANAYFVDAPNDSKELSFLCAGQFEQIPSPRDLFRCYFGRFNIGIAPFTSYVYKTETMFGKRIPENGGKYADVSWLLTVAASGKIVWIAKPLLDCYMHGGNDSCQESSYDRLRLLSFLKKNKALCGASGLADYRYFIHKKFIASLPPGLNERRLKIIKRYVSRYRIRRVFRLNDYYFMFKRAVVKSIVKQKESK